MRLGPTWYEALQGVLRVVQFLITILPNILHNDRTKPARYPNGRTPTDDVFSLRFEFMTNGQIKPQAIKPHEDLLPEFPFVGIPHPTKVAESV